MIGVVRHIKKREKPYQRADDDTLKSRTLLISPFLFHYLSIINDINIIVMIIESIVIGIERSDDGQEVKKIGTSNDVSASSTRRDRDRRAAPRARPSAVIFRPKIAANATLPTTTTTTTTTTAAVVESAAEVAAEVAAATEPVVKTEPGAPSQPQQSTATSSLPSTLPTNTGLSYAYLF
jgi:hypothetical protein